MWTITLSITSLMIGVAILLTGIGLQGTLIGVRASIEGFSDSLIGLIMGAYFAGFIIGTQWCPHLIRRVGHIRAFAALAAVASAVALAYAILIDPWVWTVGRLLTGICLVGLYMVIESWLNQLTPNHLRGRIFAIYMTITLLAMGAGQWLIVAADPRGFVPFALVAITLSLALVPIVTTRVAQPALEEGSTSRPTRLFRHSPLAAAGALISGLTCGAFWGMGSVYAFHLDNSTGGVARFMAVVVAGGALLQWAIGRLSDSFDRRKMIMIVATIAALIGLLLFAPFAGRLSPWLLFPYGGVLFSLYSLSVALANDSAEAGEMLEISRALLRLYGLGAAVGPTLAGLAMAYFGPTALLAFMASWHLLLALIALRSLFVRAPVPVEEQAAFVPMVRTSPAALDIHPAAELQQELELKS